MLLVGCAVEENLSVHYLAAAAVQAGFRADVLGVRDPDALRSLVQPILARAPRVLGLSLSVQPLAPALLALAAAVRAAGFDGVICLGGHFATLDAERLLREAPAVDCVVRHEGERTLVELLRVVGPGRAARVEELTSIAGLALRGVAGAPMLTPPRPLPPLDELAWPSRWVPPDTVLGVGIAPMVGSRGCYGSCAYCSIHAWHRSAQGPRCRQRSLHDLCDELAWLRVEHEVRLFNFHDDNFFVPSREANLARFHGLAERLGARGIDDIGLLIKCRPDDVTSDTLDALARAGLVRALIGVDTAYAEGLRSLGRGLDEQANHRALERFGERGLAAAFNLLIFDPEATLATIEANLGFLSLHAEVPYTFGAVLVFASTPLEARLRSEGRLRGRGPTPSYELRDPRAELMRRVVDVALYHRATRSEGLHLHQQRLQLELAVRQRFYAPPLPEAQAAELGSVIGRIGASSARELGAIHDFCSRTDPRERDAIRRYTRERAERIQLDDFALLKEMLAARQAVHASAQAAELRGRAPPRVASERSRAVPLLQRHTGPR